MLSRSATRANLYRYDHFFHEGTQIFQQTQKAHGDYQPRQPIPVAADNQPDGALRSFYQAVRTGSSPYPSVIDGARAVSVVFAAIESAQQRRPITVSPMEQRESATEDRQN